MKLPTPSSTSRLTNHPSSPAAKWWWTAAGRRSNQGRRIPVKRSNRLINCSGVAARGSNAR